MVMNRTTSPAILRPEEVDRLLVLPTFTASVAARVARRVNINASELRVPSITEDPSAAWVAEGAEIPASDATVAEITVTPAKLAGLSVITRELADDSSPAAAEVVGQGLARDLARQVDKAFFGNLSGVAPKGLESLAGVTAVNAGAAWTNVDPFAEGAAAAEGVGADLAAWVAHPDDALALAKLKTGTGSNLPLLAQDPTQPARRVLAGLPLYVSSAVTAGTIWGLDPTRALLVVRDGAEVTADASVYFSSDRVAVRARLRVGFGFPDPAAIVKVKVTP